MSVLVDHQIQRLGRRGYIAPFDEAMVQPSSYDVKLGNTFYRFRDDPDASQIIDPFDQAVLDGLMRKEYVQDDGVAILNANEFILAHTKEVVNVPTNLVCRLEGKSSIARLGTAIHITAGYIDPGFRGSITLEIVNFAPKPFILTPGMPIAQIGFIVTASNPTNIYQGRYQDDTVATPSRYGKDRRTT